MLIGTKWGVSPRWITEGEEKHVFSCIHVEIWDPALFFLSTPPSFSQTNRGSHVCCLHALSANDLDIFFIVNQLVYP